MDPIFGRRVIIVSAAADLRQGRVVPGGHIEKMRLCLRSHAQTFSFRANLFGLVVAASKNLIMINDYPLILVYLVLAKKSLLFSSLNKTDKIFLFKCQHNWISYLFWCAPRSKLFVFRAKKGRECFVDIKMRRVGDGV